MAWHSLRAASSAPSEAELFRMEQGREVGELARLLFPNGVLVSKTATKSAAETTQEHISSGQPAIFEATFRTGNFVAKADVLRRGTAEWQVLEVKSSFSDTKNLSALIDDLAYTVMVVKRAGLKVESAALVLLSRKYRYGDSPNELFEIVDPSIDVFERAAEFEASAEMAQQALFACIPPPPALVSACRECAFFENECLGRRIKNTVLELPALHHAKLRKLSDAGITDLACLPADFELNACQLRARTSALSGDRIVEPKLAEALDGVVWPTYYLDFETVATTLPLYKNHGCHEQVLTQYSLHHRESFGGEVAHSEYLAEPTRDCQVDVAVSLIRDLGTHGSIIVYSPFEKTRLAALRDALPELAAELQAITDRLVDLLPIIRDHLYDPGFKGSFSIKKVLPVLVPDLSYDSLPIRDGTTAVARFARMARGEITGPEAEGTRQELLAYCKLDTLAMVRLHDALYHLAFRTQQAGG